MINNLYIKATPTTAAVTWGSITGTLSAQTDLQSALDAKQATLVSGTNIKTVNSTSLLGAGDVSVGTVTSVGVTAGTGISVSGSPITSSGSITVTNSAPDQVVAIAAGTGIGVTGTYPNFTVTNSAPSSGGTVTSVAALTLGTTGTDLTSTVATGTTTPVITLNVPTASAANRGALSSADWTTFNNKQASGNYITALTGEATATGPGSVNTTLSNSAVIGKVLTGLNLAGGGTIADTDSILLAFGKVQNQISGLLGGVTFQGVWNASTNTPTLTSSIGTKGYYYIVNVAGSTNLNGITDWKIGDWAVFNGTTWDKVDNTDAVSSVNGFSGAVSLTTADISEVTNLYYTEARVNANTNVAANTAARHNAVTIGTANGLSLSDQALSLASASASVTGALSSTDWTTFNNKQATLVSGTNIKTVNGNTLLGSGDLVIPVFQLQGTNFLSVLANGTPAQNGQAVRDAYTAAQAMTPSGAAKSATNRVVILLAPGYYTFSEATLGTFTINQSFIDFESLSGVTDVYFSSMQVNSDPGINVRISGINTTKNNYYGHAAFAVASSGDGTEDIYIKNCVGGNYSFCAFAAAFVGTIENCVGGNYSFLYGTSSAPPTGIIASGNVYISLYGTFKNCTAGSNSFLYSSGFGNISSYGTIDNCTSGSDSFLSGNAIYTDNNGTISNCVSTGSNSFCSKGNFVQNAGRIVNCTSQGGYSFVITTGATGYAINSGLISNSNCDSTDPCFAVKATATYTGNNTGGKIINCTATNSTGAFCGDLGQNTGLISNCIASQQAFCCNNAAGISGNILRSTMTGDTFTVGATGGGRVVLGIDNTGVVNY